MEIADLTKRLETLNVLKHFYTSHVDVDDEMSEYVPSFKKMREQITETSCHCKKYANMSFLEKMDSALPDCDCDGENTANDHDDIIDAEPKTKEQLDAELCNYFV